MKSVFVGGLLGGIVLIIWGMISWVVLPWHKDTMNAFKDERSVAAVITANVPKSGIFILPIAQPTEATTTPQPMIFAAVTLEGMKPMNTALLFTYLNDLIAAFLVAFLLSKTNGLKYFGRVGFVLLIAFTAGVIKHGPYWNWFGFDTHYTLVNFADLMAGWLLAGLVMAKFITSKR